MCSTAAGMPPVQQILLPTLAAFTADPADSPVALRVYSSRFRVNLRQKPQSADISQIFREIKCSGAKST
jgi:hypothetical protein